MKQNSTTWKRTSIPQLYRHSSGTLYARLNAGGKKTWRSLKTQTVSIAKVELEKLLRAEEERAESMGTVSPKTNLTLGETREIRLREIANNPSIKPSTLRYWNQIAKSLTASWKGFDLVEARKVTPAMCQDWAGRYSKTASPTRFNNSLSFLRQLFEVAIANGARVTNPTKGIKRVKANEKDLTSILPSKSLFAKWVDEIRSAGGRFSQDCGDFVEFLAYSGVRLGETPFITWDKIDEARGEIVVSGHPTLGTKNRSIRRVPLISAMTDLIGNIRTRRESEDGPHPVLRVREAQKAMDHAAEKVGMARLTHHDLRHFFATICIESGVDIPTVSKWLGHKDGGALAMKVYGHLRNEHSLAAAKKVSFSGAVGK